MNSFRLTPRYLILTLAIFLLELAIAVWGGKSLLRTFGGDVLVVVLLYCAVRIGVPSRSPRVILGVWVFAFAVEFIQYFDPIGRLGLQHHRVLSIVVGRTFSWSDLGAYTMGAGICAVLLSLDSREADAAGWPQEQGQ